jgi:hypothetical protein
VLDFTFSFSNTNGNVSGTVTGEIFGLMDNATGPATNVIVDSYPAGLGLPAPPLTIFSGVTENLFTVSAGEITAADYLAVTINNGLSLNSGGNLNALVNGPAGKTVLNAGGFSGATYTPVSVPAPLLATGPVAASVTLLATGLATLWPWCRRRRRTAPA